VSAIDAPIKRRSDLHDLARAVKREAAKRIARQSIRAEALRLGQSWFSEVRSQTQGRFKKSNKAQSVTSISELQLVLDTDILWILEGMQVIDANQHARLRSCFELRNHSAHGESRRSQTTICCRSSRTSSRSS
jgi:hypothetical protein